MKGRILITGGAGFLGRGIMRRAKRDGWDATFTVYSRDEYKQFLCKKAYPDARYVLGDVCDTERLAATMTGHDVVIHAGALKHIPESEANVAEAIRINVMGSQSVVRAARAACVPRTVGISTDKAVAPVNVYGMTKALMERIFADGNVGSVKFTTCRYGNVVGSTGSVIPRFEEQAKTTGEVTITDPNMTRFWISIDDAVDLITTSLESNVMAGATIIPVPMSMTINAIAKLFTNNIRVIGIRPGEKLHEDLVAQGELHRVTWYGKYYMLCPTNKPRNDIKELELSSGNPKFWMDSDKMLHLIEDAKCV